MYSGPHNTRNPPVSEVDSKFIEIDHELSVQLKYIWFIIYFQDTIFIHLFGEEAILLLFIICMEGVWLFYEKLD